MAFPTQHKSRDEILREADAQWRQFLDDMRLGSPFQRYPGSINDHARTQLHNGLTATAHQHAAGLCRKLVPTCGRELAKRIANDFFLRMDNAPRGLSRLEKAQPVLNQLIEDHNRRVRERQLKVGEQPLPPPVNLPKNRNKTGGKVLRDKKLDARDKWIYQQCCKLIPYDKIVANLKKIAPSRGWRIFSSKQRIQQIGKEYAEQNECATPPPRQGL